MSTLKKAFKKSLYYIGAGFDWQPLLRMSHITQTFFYVNLFYTKEQVLRKLFGELNNHEDIELLSVKSEVFADGQLPEGLMPAYLEGFEKARGSMGLMEWHGYRMEFQHTLQEEKWMLEATLKLKHNGKTIRLIYLSAEGLAAYLALSDNGKTAPRVLCTIQTGILEWPNRLMTRFLEKLENKPDIWVRGYETDSYEANPYILSETDRLYTVKGCDFLLPWWVSTTYLPFESDQGSPRRVKAFITNKAHERILSLGFKDYKGNSILGDGLKSLTPGNVPAKSLVIVTDRTVRLIPAGLPVKVETWENLFKKGKKGNPYGCRMKDCLDILRSIDAKGQYDCIIFLPYGYEDEGHLLDSFLSENHRATMKAVVGNPLDLVDLKSEASMDRDIDDMVGIWKITDPFTEDWNLLTIKQKDDIPTFFLH